MSPAASTQSSPRPRHERSRRDAARSAAVHRLRRASARQRFRRRAGADDRVSRGGFPARPSRSRGHPSGRTRYAGAAARAPCRLRSVVPRPFPGRGRAGARRGRRRGRRSGAGRAARRGRAARSRRGQRNRGDASGPRGSGKPCGAFRARRVGACRGGAAIDTGVRAAALSSTCGEPCETRCATMARSSSSAG